MLDHVQDAAVPGRTEVAGRLARRPKFGISAGVVSDVGKVCDFAIVMLASMFAFEIYLHAIINYVEGRDRYALTAAAGAILFVTGFQQAGGYRIERLARLRWQTTSVMLGWLGTVSVLAAVGFVTKVSESYSRGWALGWAVATLGLLLMERSVLYLLICSWTRRGYLQRNVVIVGAGEMTEQLIERLYARHNESVAVVGVFDDRRDRVPASCAHCKVLGTTDDLLQFARQSPIDEIIVALPLSAEDRLKELFDKLKLLPVDLRLSAHPMTRAFPVTGVSRVGDVTLLEVFDRPLKDWSGVYKWLEDKIIASAALLFLAPLMLLIAILIRLDSRGSILFVQERFGFNNTVIRVLKFRTMHIALADPSGGARTVRNDARVTRIGRYLRKWSLDELPQLFNVLKGDMSIVGPRPHALAMKADGRQLYHEAVKDYAYRHRIKPGLTGWAQVNGLRGEIDGLEKARQRVAYDLHYIENWSIWLDLYIMFRTVKVVLAMKDAF
jgi:Undecaprenyl-phosphate glucose phosphotransferase